MDGISAKAPQVLFWDDMLAVIAKPVGMPSQDDKSGAFSVLGWMRQRGEAYPVQRLDRPAAGIMCVARTREAASFLSAALHCGEISKHYLALAENPAFFAGVSCGADGSGAVGAGVGASVTCGGISVAGSGDTSVTGVCSADGVCGAGSRGASVTGTCSADGVYAPPSSDSPSQELRCYLRRDGRANKSEASDTPAPGFKEAVLRYKVLAIGRTRALLSIELLTGRHHQIRTQLSHIGCPLAGDLKYGASSQLRQGGIALFSCRLSLPHPDGRRLTFTALPTGRAWEPFLGAVKAKLDV